MCKIEHSIIFAIDVPMISSELTTIVGTAINRVEKQLLGCYKGTQEVSYQVLKKDILDWRELVKFLISQNQECILHVEENGDCFLGMRSYNYHKDLLTKSIGNMQCCTKEEAEQLDYYSKDMLTNQHYITR